MIHDSLSPIRFKNLRFSDWIILIFFPACLLIPGGGEAAMLLSCLYGLFLLIIGKARWRSLYKNEKQIILLFLAWFLLKALSIAWSINPQHSLNKLGTSLHFFLALPVLFAIRESAYEKSRLILLSIRFTLLITGIYAFLLLVFGLVDATPALRFEAQAQNPLIFATILSVMTLWALERLITRPRIIDFLGLLLGCCSIYFSYSRGPLAMLAVCSLILLIIYALRGDRYRKILGALILLALLLTIYMIYKLHGSPQGFEQIPQSIYRYFTNPSALGSLVEFRIDMWVSSVKAFIEQPFFGYGVGNAHAAATPYFYYELPKIFSHVHNMWLQIALEMGMIGIIFTLVWVILLLRLAYRNRASGLHWGLMISLITIYLFNGLSNIVFDQGLLNSFFVMSALILISREVKHLKIPN